MTETTIHEFLTGFQLRRAVCQALLEQSRQQSALIVADDYEQLLELLKAKQALLDHLGQLARDQSPLRAAWFSSRAQMPSGERARCDAVLAETESLLALLLTEEQSCSQRLTVRRDTTRRGLESLSVGVQAQHAYRPVEEVVSSRFDLNT